MEAIIYPTKSSGTQNVICKSSSSQNNGYIYPRTDNGWVDSIFYLNTTTGWNTLATTWPSLNNWHHTIATWDGSTMKILYKRTIICKSICYRNYNDQFKSFDHW